MDTFGSKRSRRLNGLAVSSKRLIRPCLTNLTNKLSVAGATALCLNSDDVSAHLNGEEKCFDSLYLLANGSNAAGHLASELTSTSETNEEYLSQLTPANTPLVMQHQSSGLNSSLSVTIPM